MATLASMVGKLRIRIDDDRESVTFLNNRLEAWLEDSMVRYDKERSIESLTAPEQVVVLLLAKIEFCYYMALNYSKYPRITVSNAVNVDKASVADAYLKLALRIQNEYEDMVSYLKMPEIVEERFVRISELAQGILPRDADKGILAVNLELHSKKAGEVWLQWNKVFHNDFYAYLIFRGTSAGINSFNSTCLLELTVINQTSYKDTTVVPGATYYYRVYPVTRNAYSEWTANTNNTGIVNDLATLRGSNELSVAAI